MMIDTIVIHILIITYKTAEKKARTAKEIGSGARLAAKEKTMLNGMEISITRRRPRTSASQPHM